MLKADPLIRTKLRLPFTRRGLVPRPRLEEQVAQGLCGPLTLVTAPAGFGKTTLVASTIAGCGLPVAWLSLDKEDNLAGRFLIYLVAALQEADSTIGGEAAQLAEAQQAPPEAVLTSLINDLDTTCREIVLVLDDFQFISSQAVHSTVAFLLEHCPRKFHLVIASRSDPPFPLVRLRARGQMVELRAADLRFTAPEAAQFLNDVMGLHLDDGSMAVLEERTEGWIAGLQMAALSMRDRKDVVGFIEGFSGTNRFILDYLLEEVLASQPQEIQHFLVWSSILKRLSASLCDAVLAKDVGNIQEGKVRSTSPQSFSLSQSAPILDYLEKANLFVVPLDDDRRWYRYHNLFADLLKARLYQSGPGLAALFLSRAAEWCEREGQIADAVGYAFDARDFQKAADLIAKYWQTAVNNGEIETVWSWLDALPEDTVRNSAPLGVAYCWVLWLKAQMGAIEAHLVDAERALSVQVASERSNPNDPAYIGLPASLAILRSIVARYGNDFKAAVALAERALSLVPENLPPQANAQMRSLIFLALASAYDGAGDLEKAVSAYDETIRLSRLGNSPAGLGITFRLAGVLRLLGRLRAADAACRDALGYIQAQGMARLPAAGIFHVAMSEVLVERNDLEAAESHLSQGIELGRRSGRLDGVKNAAYSLSRLRQARNDMNGALAAVQEAELALEKPPSALARAEMLALKARILARKGALIEAAQCVEEAVHLAGRDRGQTGEMAALAACRVVLAQGKPDEAIAGLTQALAAAEASGWFGAAIELRILRSLALTRQGDTQAAEKDLERALALAEPEGYVRIFIDEGRSLQLLMAQWLTHASVGPLRDYATFLLSHFDAEPDEVKLTQKKTSPTSDLVEPLSQRELEVLSLISLGKTNQEIARQLFISVGTVKAHTASIYRRLDVANRTEAVARARQLGFIP
ncbi:MAG TPA: LuxR C-terminal-related transcriptional regulator [Anaerolineaceae bacterium]|nr:LuxR C-terminal-related transcriptional regulator [Anaerolineaceae bacterium]